MFQPIPCGETNNPMAGSGQISLSETINRTIPKTPPRFLPDAAVMNHVSQPRQRLLSRTCQVEAARRSSVNSRNLVLQPIAPRITKNNYAAVPAQPRQLQALTMRLAGRARNSITSETSRTSTHTRSSTRSIRSRRSTSATIRRSSAPAVIVSELINAIGDNSVAGSSESGSQDNLVLENLVEESDRVAFLTNVTGRKPLQSRRRTRYTAAEHRSTSPSPGKLYSETSKTSSKLVYQREVKKPKEYKMSKSKSSRLTLTRDLFEPLLQGALDISKMKKSKRTKQHHPMVSSLEERKPRVQKQPKAKPQHPTKVLRRPSTADPTMERHTDALTSLTKEEIDPKIQTVASTHIEAGTLNKAVAVGAGNEVGKQCLTSSTSQYAKRETGTDLRDKGDGVGQQLTQGAIQCIKSSSTDEMVPLVTSESVKTEESVTNTLKLTIKPDQQFNNQRLSSSMESKLGDVELTMQQKESSKSSKVELAEVMTESSSKGKITEVISKSSKGRNTGEHPTNTIQSSKSVSSTSSNDTERMKETKTRTTEVACATKCNKAKSKVKSTTSSGKQHTDRHSHKHKPRRKTHAVRRHSEPHIKTNRSSHTKQLANSFQRRHSMNGSDRKGNKSTRLKRDENEAIKGTSLANNKTCMKQNAAVLNPNRTSRLVSEETTQEQETLRKSDTNNKTVKTNVKPLPPNPTTTQTPRTAFVGPLTKEQYEHNAMKSESIAQQRPTCVVRSGGTGSSNGKKTKEIPETEEDKVTKVSTPEQLSLSRQKAAQRISEALRKKQQADEAKKHTVQSQDLQRQKDRMALSEIKVRRRKEIYAINKLMTLWNTKRANEFQEVAGNFIGPKKQGASTA